MSLSDGHCEGKECPRDVTRDTPLDLQEKWFVVPVGGPVQSGNNLGRPDPEDGGHLALLCPGCARKEPALPQCAIRVREIRERLGLSLPPEAAGG